MSVDELLKLPAPPRDWKQAIHYVAPGKTAASEADATLDRLAEIWAHNSDKAGPTADVRELLVAAIEARPGLLPGLLKWLPVREDVIHRVRKASESVADLRGGKVAEWLLFHDPDERPKLIEAVGKAHDSERGYIVGKEAMTALAEADWDAAAPLLTMFRNGKEPRTRVQALALMFAHARDQERKGLREELRAVVADVAAPGGARDIALTALLADDWPGRDLWLLSLFHEPTFSFVTDDPISYEFAGQVVASDPDHWIPVMTELLGSSDRVVRSAAVNALGQFNLEDGRADALRPILCWLSDPTWAEDHGMYRLRLVQTVGKLGLREAIPDLVWVLEHDEDSTMKAYAAEALSDFHSSNGSVAIRRALAATDDFGDAQLLAKALLATGALSSDEIADCIVEAGRGGARDNPLEMKGSFAQKLGSIATSSAHNDDGVTRSLIARHEARPDDAVILKAVLETDSPSTARFLATHLRDDDVRLLEAAIVHRDALRAHASEELRRVAAGHGVAAALATVLLGDAKSTAARLAHGTADERRAVLATARAVREQLDARAVAGLFGVSPALDRAAEAYLEAVDTPPARAAIYARYPGEARILGAGVGMFSKWEEEYRKRIVTGEVDEVIVLVSGGTWSKEAVRVEIVVHAGLVSTRVDDEIAPVPEAAIAELRAFLRASDFDNLPPLETEVSDGLQFEYLHLTRDGGARVFMNNPGIGDFGTPYSALTRRMMMLAPSP
jgi:hypothetical protein